MNPKLIDDHPPWPESNIIADLLSITMLAILLSKTQNYSYQTFNYQYLPINLQPYYFSTMTLIAGNGTYIGEISSQFDQNSILNQLGNYGSKFSSTSIWNEFSPYGGRLSPLSAFNPFAANPPKLYMNNIFMGYLTVNPAFANRIDPYSLRK
jgi:hypothetical protein